MKSYIKLSVAALLVVGSTQVSATEVQLDLTQTISNTISSYIESTSNELKSKLQQSLFTDSQKSLTQFIATTQANDTEAENIATQQLVVVNTASIEE
ncbi:hypothetical protein NQT69_10380 [Pseudoalteromonas shioyasakiensis]|uniref:hypothetical protein n=1 Tax=Pseudoalteromonas shioyasakiensis TaxID=1190813 RepID=UPI00211747CE|nr:hypothetical protein [Pseudoalteromonas shioyasakiensis]MCQ8878405.1 hypothetical protein [Pseudoalteromonas shioyasakiensis]